jgi:hypothetical protein
MIRSMMLVITNGIRTVRSRSVTLITTNSVRTSGFNTMLSKLGLVAPRIRRPGDGGCDCGDKAGREAVPPAYSRLHNLPCPWFHGPLPAPLRRYIVVCWVGYFDLQRDRIFPLVELWPDFRWLGRCVCGSPRSGYGSASGGHRPMAERRSPDMDADVPNIGSGDLRQSRP